MVDLAARLGISTLFYNLIENPFNDPAMVDHDPALTKDDAAKLLDSLRKAEARAKELNLHMTGRAMPRLINRYPSLAATGQEARMLPSAEQFEQVASNTQRADMKMMDDADLTSILENANALADEPYESDGHPRDIAPLADPIERQYAGSLDMMRNYDAQAFCDYPFTILFLDTYRTYVCCHATDKFLKGEHYDATTPRLYDVWNSPLMQEARHAMYENESMKVCHPRCQYFKTGGSCEAAQKSLNTL